MWVLVLYNDVFDGTLWINHYTIVYLYKIVT